MNEILMGLMLVTVFIIGVFLGQSQERRRFSRLMREGPADLQKLMKRMK